MTPDVPTMTDAQRIAQSRLLDPGGLAPSDLERVFARLMGRGIDRADLYFQHSRFESWVLEDGIVKEGSHSIEQGVGVRAISGEKTGFAYSDEIVLPALDEADVDRCAHQLVVARVKFDFVEPVAVADRGVLGGLNRWSQHWLVGGSVGARRGLRLGSSIRGSCVAGC